MDNTFHKNKQWMSATKQWMPATKRQHKYQIIMPILNSPSLLCDKSYSCSFVFDSSDKYIKK
jgi:hypothetical protein